MKTRFWEKAQEEARAARLLADAGSFAVAVGRAYYAMFNAARAALEQSGTPTSNIRTHAGLIRMFSKQIIRAKGLDPELGRILRRAEKIRLLSDYGAEKIEEDRARLVLASMDAFLDAVSKFVEGDQK
jgi:uncharacterized protein (UPF0332 family)